jgi:protocatechuate 3,4-dioxygenase beta subunit
MSRRNFQRNRVCSIASRAAPEHALTKRSELWTLRFVPAIAQLALCATLAAPARGQGPASVIGRVVDAGGQAVVGARVELRPAMRRVVSDEEGRFEFRNVGPGTYTLFVQRIGYQPATMAVAVTESGANPTIVLVAIPRILDSVRIRERANSMRYAATVIDDMGTPVPDVAVVMEGVQNTVRTDSAGHFVVSRKVHGALMIRMRKIGFAPYLGSFEMLAEREDTLRMVRLPQGLSAVQITEASGFGRDTFVYKDLDQRMRWRNHLSSVITREDLAKAGRENLCQVTGCGFRDCIILDGRGKTSMPAAAFYADQVEAIEAYPPGSDWSGNLSSRGCGGGRGRTLVIWLRKDAVPKPPARSP